MKLSAPVLLCPRVHCSRMQIRVSVWGLPPVTFHLWLLFLSSSLQPSLSALVFSKRPEHGVGVLGSPLTLPCVAYDSLQQRGVSVHWERAGGGPALEGHHLMANGSLFWPRLREQDLGRYFCKASAGTDHIMAAVQVELADLGPVFHSPQSVWVSEGEPVSLQCVSGDSAPPAHITWLRDGASLTRGKQIQGQYGGGSQRKTSGTLHLSNVSVEDQGEYVCVTHNSVLNISRNSHAAMLTVLGAPRRLQIIHGPDNVTVAVGTEASMSCVVRGFPVPTVMWFKDGRPVVNGSSYSMLAHGQRLVFRNVSEEQEGSYHCEAQNEGETARSQPAFLLLAVMDRDFVQQPSDHTARRGDSLTLVCQPPRSRPPARLAWLKNNAPLPPGPHYTLAPHGDLTFHSVQETDSGTYLCRASNPYLQRSVMSRSISLKVLAPPTVRLAPLVATVPVGAQVVFQCQVWGHPAPSIRWHKQGLHWETGGRTTVGVRNSSLFIQSVRSFDEGMYTCEAANALGRVRSTATLRVAASPIIVPWLGQVTSVLGRLVVLRCRAVGVLPISYTWSKGDQHTPITASQGRDVDDDGTLRIISVQWSDEGQYQCTAENQAGRQQRRTVLIVTAEDGPADRDKQTRHVLSAATHKEVQQMTPPSSKSNGVEQNSEMTHQPPQQGETTVQASLVDSATLVTQRFTLGNTLDFTSPLEVIGLRGRHPQIRSDHPAASDPTRPIVTQIQPPAELHQPPDLLAQSLVSNHLPWIPNPQPLLTPTPYSVTRVQSLLRIGPLNTHRAPLAAGFQLHVLESTQASSSVTGVKQSWASSPSDGPPGQPPDLSNQSTSLLPDPTRLSTKSLSEVPPLDPGLQPTIPPLDPGLQPSVPPLDPGLQPSIPPLDPGLHPSIPPLDPGLQPSIPPLDPGLQPSIPPLDPGLQPSIPPLNPGLQPSAPPLDPGLQPSAPPLDPGLQPSIPPLDPGLQPSIPPLDPGLQPSAPSLDPGLQPSIPPLDPGLQPSIPLLDPGLQPSDHNLFPASQSVFEVAPTQPLALPSHSQPSTNQSQPQPSTTMSQPQPSKTQSQSQPSTTQSQPQPSTTQSQPQPSTTQSQPQPSTTQSQPQPPTTQSQPQPSSTQSQPQPSTTQSQPQPSTTQSEPQPSTTQSQPQPPTTQSQPKPSTTQSQPQPSTTHSQPQPPTTQSQPQPPTTQSQPQPSTTQSQPQPSTTQSQPQLSTTQSQPQPPKPFPHPPSAQPQPAQPQGSQNIPKPPSPQPHPSQSSHGQTWKPRLRTTPTHPLSEASILTPSPPPALPLTPEPQSPDIQVPSSPPVTTVDPLRQNASQSANPAPPARSAGPNHSEPTERLKRNTSQSTMRTSEDPRVTPKPPSWLPVLEKHDIPIVVGVGVSLAFIFITMAFYSLVPKNEPAPIGRGVLRNLAVPCRHAERLATGKTYENRAFEDNELMAVIEQSPNTSDTRARPSSCSVLTQADPSSEGLLEGPPAQPTPEHSVIADTSLEPTHNSLVDTSLDEEKGCTFSHPSIQLQSVEDWIAGGGPEYPSFPDALPPPSPSLYRSPSPSPPSLREDGFRSSLTLRTAEPSAAPVRHSLSISHGNMPLLLSHCVSLGLTTVAVDVHFFPAASAATGGQPSTMAPATATPQGSQLGSRLAHSQEHDLTISGLRQSK